MPPNTGTTTTLLLSSVKPSDSNRWLCVPYSITPNISSSLAPAVTAIDTTPPLFIVSSVPCKRVYTPAVFILWLDFRRPVNSLYRSFEARWLQLMPSYRPSDSVDGFTSIIRRSVASVYNVPTILWRPVTSMGEWLCACYVQSPWLQWVTLYRPLTSSNFSGWLCIDYLRSHGVYRRHCIDHLTAHGWLCIDH